MAKLIFRLRGVPDDEAQEVRELLEENRVDFYETSAGNWGISMPALWLEDESDQELVQELLDEYQKKRADTAREDWQIRKNTGRHPTVFSTIASRPLASIGLILFCAVILYFSINPFLQLLK